MNATQSLIAAIALTAAAAGSAFAQEILPVSATPTGAVSRAEVVAQAVQAARQGSLRDSYDSRPAVQAQASGLSREAVRAEVRAALANGEIARLTAESYSAVPVAAAPARLTVAAR
jgi:hypothetical protein